MEVEQDGNKRVREECVDQRPADAVKKLCSGLDTRDASIVSILETDDAEEDGCYDHVELDEAQERLLFGVMRSLEEELAVPTILSVSSHPYQNEPSSAVDSDRYPSAKHAFDPSPAAFSSVTAEDPQNENFDLTDLLEKPSLFTDQDSLQNLCTLNLSKPNPPCDRKKVDIGYLLEASDDELGISPSPRSTSPGSEADIACHSIHPTEYSSEYAPSGSLCDTLHTQLLQSEVEWSSEGHFDPEFENDPASQELLKTAFSNLKASSIWAYPSIDAAATSVEPACASH